MFSGYIFVVSFLQHNNTTRIGVTSNVCKGRRVLLSANLILLAFNRGCCCQIVIVSDGGSNSFAALSYGQLEWTTGSASGGNDGQLRFVAPLFNPLLVKAHFCFGLRVHKRKIKTQCMFGFHFAMRVWISRGRSRRHTCANGF